MKKFRDSSNSPHVRCKAYLDSFTAVIFSGHVGSYASSIGHIKLAGALEGRTSVRRGIAKSIKRSIQLAADQAASHNAPREPLDAAVPSRGALEAPSGCPAADADRWT